MSAESLFVESISRHATGRGWAHLGAVRCLGLASLTCSTMQERLLTTQGKMATEAGRASQKAQSSFPGIASTATLYNRLCIRQMYADDMAAKPSGLATVTELSSD